MSLDRRHFLRAGTAAFGVSVSGWLGRLACAASGDPSRRRSCILLWMSGGPATIDLWDLKPGAPTGGPSKEIASRAPGLKISEHLPKIAQFGDRLAVVRSVSTKEGDHGRATYLVRTGNLPTGGIEFPTFGSLAAKELADAANGLPPFVCVAPQRALAPTAFGSGFLGPQFAPLLVADGQSTPTGNPTGNRAADDRRKVENLNHYAGITSTPARRPVNPAA